MITIVLVLLALLVLRKEQVEADYQVSQAHRFTAHKLVGTGGYH